MHRLTKQFTEYCQTNLCLDEAETYHYQSLPICLIDCVYSLRARYYSVTVPVVERYAARYLSGDKNSPEDTISRFLRNIQNAGGPERFADTVLKNHQKLGGKNPVPKEHVCYQLAQYLHYLHIDTLADFQQFPSQELLEVVLRAVRGMGDAGVNYLFMLAGDSSRCKPDVHIHQCIKDACGCTISNEECQTLFTETVQNLRQTHPGLTVRALDGVIWRKYQSGKE